MIDVAKAVQRPDPAPLCRSVALGHARHDTATRYASSVPAHLSTTRLAVRWLAVERSTPRAGLPPCAVHTRSFHRSTRTVFHPIKRGDQAAPRTDIGAPSVAPVYAVQSGVVVMAQVDGSHGNSILLQHVQRENWLRSPKRLRPRHQRRAR